MYCHVLRKPIESQTTNHPVNQQKNLVCIYVNMKKAF